MWPIRSKYSTFPFHKICAEKKLQQPVFFVVMLFEKFMVSNNKVVILFSEIKHSVINVIQTKNQSVYFSNTA